MEKLLKKDNKFQWSENCQESMDTILVFLDQKKEFHVHVDALFVAFVVVLAQPCESAIDHLISFASRKLSTTDKNYTTAEREGLAMVYALLTFCHYLLGGHFKMYIDHSALKYLFNKPMLGGKICRCLLLFQEFDFEVIVNLG